MSSSESHSLLGYSVSFWIDDDGSCAEATATLASRWRGLTLDEASRLEPDMRFSPPTDSTIQTSAVTGSP